MNVKQRVKGILPLLDEHYPETKCYLDHENGYQLLVATILSAQCTDDRVNLVTKDLFKKYQSIEDFAFADITELEEDIRSTGYYRSKAKGIIGSMSLLLNEYNKILPSDIDELTKFPSVGRKTANVIRTHIFNIPSIVVDTHVTRLSNLLGLVNSKDPVKIEFKLMEILPKKHWSLFNTQIIAHGRAICIARRPRCTECFLSPYCKYFSERML